jgi:hypothetical protein
MPILLWIAVWCNLTGIAAGWQETVSPIQASDEARRDRRTA